ncbi:MAG: hypothetical protein Fur0037_04700 [Planctomycetota bacterium]
MPLYGGNQGTMHASNASDIVADSDGNLYVLFATGASSPGQGDLRIAYAAAGNYATWTSSSVAADPDLLAGNVTYAHYALARGESGTVYAIYGKKTAEQFQNLYFRIYGAGVALTPEIPLLAGTEVDAFQIVCGVQAELAHSSLLAVASGTPPSAPEGRVVFVSAGTLARSFAFGTSCQGTLPDLPRLRPSTLPVGGTSYTLVADLLPANQFGLMFLGGNCQRPFVPLDPLGLTGCAVFTNSWGTIGFTIGASGAGSLSIALPSNPPFANMALYFGALAFAPGANPAGAVTTNALMTWIR